MSRLGLRIWLIAAVLWPFVWGMLLGVLHACKSAKAEYDTVSMEWGCGFVLLFFAGLLLIPYPLASLLKQRGIKNNQAVAIAVLIAVFLGMIEGIIAFSLWYEVLFNLTGFGG